MEETTFELGNGVYKLQKMPEYEEMTEEEEKTILTLFNGLLEAIRIVENRTTPEDYKDRLDAKGYDEITITGSEQYRVTVVHRRRLTEPQIVFAVNLFNPTK